MQVIITAAGRGQRFLKAGFQTPKILIPFFHHEAIVHVVRSFPKEWKKIIVLADDFDSKNLSILDHVMINKTHNVKIISTKYSNSGPVNSVQAALAYLDENKPVWISYGDVAFYDSVELIQKKWSSYEFGFLNYTGFHVTYLGPNTYCHVELSDDQLEVIRISEKRRLRSCIFEEVTSAGVYFFKNMDLLRNTLGYFNKVESELEQNREIYMSDLMEYIFTTALK